MPRPNPEGGYIIAAGELGAFSVCPQAWYLTYSEAAATQSPTDRSALGQTLHRDWSSFFEESVTLGALFRYLVILSCLMLLAFMFVSPYPVPLGKLFRLSYRDRGLQLLLLLGVSGWLMRIFWREAQRRHAGSGFTKSAVTVAIDGGTLLPERQYVSTHQGLAGKPDALVREDGIVIPIERKPLAKKLRDRYVAQLLVYMRLVEEFEGVRPPHGYLILGPTCRRIKIHNSEAKQQWVSSMLTEMRGVLEGEEPKAMPHPKKCAGCEVRERCTWRRDLPTSSGR